MKVPTLTIRAVRAAVLSLCLLGCSAQFTAQVPAPEKIRAQGYLTDLAGVVDATWKPRIEALCSELDKKSGAQLAVVTIRSLEGEPIEEYANRWLRAWGVGGKENKGALLILAVKDKKMRLEVGYGLEPVLPDGFAGNVLREMREPLRRGSYGEALFNGAKTVSDRVTNPTGAQPGTAPSEPASQPPAQSTDDSPGFALPFLPVIVIILLIVAMRRKFIGRSAGGVWTSGGFGGYDSSSSSYDSSSSSDFGGFGGGDSGGGGASSDW